MEKSKLANELCTIFDKKITSYYRQTYKGIIGRVQLEVLNYLHLNKKTTVKDLINDLNIPKQHISKILIKFEIDKLIECKINSNDRRAKFYSLTKEGLSLIEQHINNSNEYYEKLIKKLSQEEQEELTNAMQKMLELLKKL